MNDRTGQQIGNYQLSRLLGHGGFAEVYLAEHRHLKTPAAIKLLSGKLSGRHVQAFMAEAQAIAQLRHPHIVRVLDFGFEHTMPFLVMEYLPGGTLRDQHSQESMAPLNLVASYVQQIASALAYAHARKLIHRDVKPENLLLAENDILQLSDFGIVAVAHSTASMSTIDSSGTIHYMAPEQIQGRPSPASDQYALAVCVYEWLCGERPFTGSSHIEIAMKHLSQEPPPLQLKVPALAGKVEQVVLQALAKEPKDRFATIQDFADAFTHACHGADGTTFRKLPAGATPTPEADGERSGEMFVPSIPQQESSSLHPSTSAAGGAAPAESAHAPEKQPASAEQEQVPEELDPKAVWERVKWKDVPSTWHVLDEPLSQTINRAFRAAFFGAFSFGGLAALAEAVSSSIHSTLYTLTQMFVIGIVSGALFGFILAPLSRSRLVLMPDGFIRFSNRGGIPTCIISYKEVEDIRFDSIKKNLVVTTSWSGTPKDDRMNPALRSSLRSARPMRLGGPVDIRGFDEAPHIIAQRVERAYTSFKARNNLP